MVKKKKVALLLSSGAAKGFAHLGVLKVLEKHKVPIDLIVGTSMGSLVGAHYAYVPNAEYWIEKLSELSPFEAISLKDIHFRLKGFITGNSVKKLLDKNLEKAKFKDTLIPLIVNVTDIKKNKAIKYDKGKLSDAVRASISIPLIFDVLKDKNRILVDGGVIDPIGSQWIKGKKFDLVIVVNVNTADDVISRRINPFDLLLRTIEVMQKENVHSKVKEMKNVVLIEPNLKGLRQIDFHKGKEFIKRGEEAAKKAMRKIKKFI